jgi:hypothetical protein
VEQVEDKDKIDLISAERHRTNLQELDNISEVFMSSHMAETHFCTDHHYLGSEPKSCEVCQLRELLISLREQALARLEAALAAESKNISKARKTDA